MLHEIQPMRNVLFISKNKRERERERERERSLMLNPNL